MRFRAALSVLACAALVAACGATTGSHTPTQAASASQGLRYADCMRSRGVTNFPDPAQGGGFDVRSLGSETSAPTFRSAATACATLRPGGSAPQITSEQVYEMAAKVRCIRQHGFPRLPDPTPASGGEGITNLPVGWNPEAPASVKARKACANVGIAIPGWGVAWYGPVD